MKKIVACCQMILLVVLLALSGPARTAAGIKGKIAATGRTLNGAASRVKGKTVAGYGKTKNAGGKAVSKTKAVGKGVGGTTARGVRAIRRGAGRTGEMFRGRSDSSIQSDVRERLNRDSSTEKWYSDVKSGLVTIKTPSQHHGDIGTVVSDLRKIEGVKSVYVIAE